MFLSRAATAKSSSQQTTRRAAIAVSANATNEHKWQEEARDELSLDWLLRARDFAGALTLLQSQKESRRWSHGRIGNVKDGAALSDTELAMWLGYAAFHLGDFECALAAYKSAGEAARLETACCMFHLGMLRQARELAEETPHSSLRTRLLLHIAEQREEQRMVMQFIEQLEEPKEAMARQEEAASVDESDAQQLASVAEQLCLAAVYFARRQFQEAADVYKKVLVKHRSFVALQVYIAMCYFELDYHDVSNQLLQPFLDATPDSLLALNLKSCNMLRLFDGATAETALRESVANIVRASDSSKEKDGEVSSEALEEAMARVSENDVIRHNLVVFREGESALQVLPPLLDVLPEARLNLITYHLRSGVGTDQARELFRLVGSSASECDTVVGRQCMASYMLLNGDFDDACLYLDSIKPYMQGSEEFYANFGIALAAEGRFVEAEEMLVQVKSKAILEQYHFQAWLARTYIMNERAWDAWDLYLKMDASADSFNLLRLIANDCYRTGAFFVSAKAFDVLERLDPTPEFWQGKCGACCGALQMVVAGKEREERLLDVLALLRNSADRPQAQQVLDVVLSFVEQRGLGATDVSDSVSEELF